MYYRYISNVHSLGYHCILTWQFHCFKISIQDIAQLIIERPTIMTPVLEEGPASQETYQALLGLYTLALQQAIDLQEANFPWVRFPDSCLVFFTDFLIVVWYSSLTPL